tara:strand:- start:489 stop:635 length:147 start_codon:yes stop_codon:yes gene_type:complete
MMNANISNKYALVITNDIMNSFDKDSKADPHFRFIIISIDSPKLKQQG